eukprot:6176470-Pleurochrysis_carterae.AAC.2
MGKGNAPLSSVHSASCSASCARLAYAAASGAWHWHSGTELLEMSASALVADVGSTLSGAGSTGSLSAALEDGSTQLVPLRLDHL